MVPDDGASMQVGYDGELKACPFCGGSEIAIIATQVYADGDPEDDRIVYWAKCEGEGCQTTGPVRWKLYLAAEAWNTRP
jgi:hypothetical protein